MNTNIVAPIKAPDSATRPVRVGIVGTGYIAEFHARSIQAIDDLNLAAVCDANLKSAQSFATTWNVRDAYGSIDEMLEWGKLDCIHLLTPPDLHHPLAKKALEAGVHVFLEKPMCTSVAEADELLDLARRNKLHLGVSHNFMFMDAYLRLREIVNSGAIGPIDQVTFHHLFELPQVRFGPFDSWMMRHPGNVMFETGPHLISMLLDLTGQPEDLSVLADRKVTLPGGAEVFRRWRIRATAGRAAIDININFGPGFPQRIIFVRGLFGSATVDLDANTCVIDQRTPLDIDLDRYSRSRKHAAQLRSQAWKTLSDYVLGKFKIRKRGNPYQNSITDCGASFYGSMKSGSPLDLRIEGSRARDIIACCAKIVESANILTTAVTEQPPILTLKNQPTVLVLGAGGFIGRELVRQLIDAGYYVRAMVRSSSAALSDLFSDHLEIVQGDIRSKSDLLTSMSGIDVVYHLAHAQVKTWEEYQRNDIDPTRLVGEACLEAKIERLIYTGTIASYYTGARAGTITEDTPLDSQMQSRDYYSRAKAASEAILVGMHQTQQLPLVIFRPGIVIGRGGNPFHWGVGRFSGNVCEVWGDGNHKLPFVLVSDVAAALVRGMQVKEINGHLYNLVDTPSLTARDYLAELQRKGRLNLNVHYRPIWKFYLSDLAKWTVKVVVKHPDRIRFPSYFDWESRTQMAIFNCSRARTELAWCPTGSRQRLVEDGIGDALKSWLDATI